MTQVKSQIPAALQRLAHPARRAILIALGEAPQSVQALSQSLHLPLSTIRHHLRQLREWRMVISSMREESQQFFLGAGMQVMFLDDRAVITLDLGDDQRIMINMARDPAQWGENYEAQDS